MFRHHSLLLICVINHIGSSPVTGDMVIFKSVPVQVDFVCDSRLFFDFFCRLFWNSAVMPKVISKRRLNAWTIYYKITSGLVFDIGIFVKTATHYEHRIQKDNAQSQRNHNKDRPALIALKIGLRHTGNNCSGICLFSFYGNGILLYIADSLDR